MKEVVEKLPSIIIERPKMPRATWEALRAHINRERLRKKQELEQNQQVERLKLERELKKKEEALTLEQTKEQIAQLEAQLTKHKEEKHQLFNTLKKVLYEDETKRRSREVVVPHPNLYMQTTGRHGNSAHLPANSVYMKPHPQLVTGVPSLPLQSVASTSQPVTVIQRTKRPTSPSPVRVGQTYYRPPVAATSLTLPSATNSSVPTKYLITTTGALPAATSLYVAGNPQPAPRPAHFAATTLEEFQRAAAVEKQNLSVPQSVVARSIAQLQQQPPAAHVTISTAPATFRAGSIVTGFPRYASQPATAATVSAAPRGVPPQTRFYLVTSDQQAAASQRQ